VFLAFAGGWILLVVTALLIYLFWKQPAFPSVAGQTPEQVTQALSVHKQLSDQWSESLTKVFDLLVTKTVLPIVTLLLGYLFGKAKSSG
jgi:H+/Cl- antiporter ClcA